MADKEERSVLKDILEQAYDEIIVPRFKDTVKNAIVDLIYTAGDYLASVVERRICKNNAVYNGKGTHTNYNGQYVKSNGVRTIQSNQQNITQIQQKQDIGLRASNDLTYVVAPSAKEAEDWANTLKNDIRTYGMARVATLYEKAGMHTMPNDFSYGWTNENDINYRRNADGWAFDMCAKPKPLPNKSKTAEQN